MASVKKRKTPDERIEKLSGELKRLKQARADAQKTKAQKKFNGIVNGTRAATAKVNELFKKIKPGSIAFAPRSDDLDDDKTPIFSFEFEDGAKFTSKSKMAKLYEPILKEHADLTPEQKDFVIDYAAFLLPVYLKTIHDGVDAKWVEMEEVYEAIEEM